MLLYPAAYAHRSFAFNSHLNSDGTVNEANVHSTVIIDARDISTGYRDLREPLDLAQGGTLGRVHKGMTIIRLAGRIQAPDGPTQAGTISDRERAMLAAFDPALCYADSPTTDGAYAFTFCEKTTDTSTYPAGYIPLKYFCRPAGRPEMTERIAEGPFRGWSMALVAPDPRCYEQTDGTATLTPASPNATCYNNGNVPGPLRVTITMAGAGSATWTLSDGTTSFILNLSGLSNGNVVVAYMETSGLYGRGRRITLNGTDAFSRKVSSASTWLTGPGVSSKTYTMTNTTNVTSCVLAWGQTWA